MNGSYGQPEQPLDSHKKYQRPPILAGYTYDGRQSYQARDEGRLLAIRLETNRTCNLRCRYCYAMSGEHLPDEMPYDMLVSIVEQAHELGAQSVVVIGGGEPTLHLRFRELISRIHALDMIPMIFSNAMAVTPELAEFLYARGASVMVKLDSLRRRKQDFLAGLDGAFRAMQRGIRNLRQAGFDRPRDPRRLRLGASFVSCRLNLEEIEQIWHYCRQGNIFPNMEVLTPTGRARDELADQGLTLEEIRDYKQRLLDIDRRCYGFDWLPYTPLTASGCLQHLYSLYITIEGNVRPCAPVKFDEHPALKEGGVYPHNVRVRPLREIYNDPLFQYARYIDTHLEGKCSRCEHHQECIGCRGYSYSVGVNEGKDPYEALRSECRQCFYTPKLGEVLQ